VTRLLRLDRWFDGDSPFDLYNRNDVKHFKLETGEVTVDGDIPAGIGIVEEIQPEGGSFAAFRNRRSDSVLLDPMTKEVISKVAELDENGKEKIDRFGKMVYRVNDRWFVLNLKMVWKDAPKRDQALGGR
jgi:hypothetical protein